MPSTPQNVITLLKRQFRRNVDQRSGEVLGGKDNAVDLLQPGAEILEDAAQARVRAISRVLASQAERRYGVVQFRRAVLHNSLLLPEEVEGWIIDQALREGAPSWWVSGVAIDPDDIKAEKDTVVIGPLRLAKPEWDAQSLEKPSLGRHALQYLKASGERGEQDVRAFGDLDQLRRLSLELAAQIPWPGAHAWEEAQATMFVLTGWLPSADGFAQQITRRKGYREIALKTMALAVFHTENEHKPLATRWRMWGALHPEWAYNHATTFGFDSRRAVRRLLGMPEPPKRGKQAACTVTIDDITYAHAQVPGRAHFIGDIEKLSEDRDPEELVHPPLLTAEKELAQIRKIFVRRLSKAQEDTSGAESQAAADVLKLIERAQSSDADSQANILAHIRRVQRTLIDRDNAPTPGILKRLDERLATLHSESLRWSH